jgi:HNH endonuclease
VGCCRLSRPAGWPATPPSPAIVHRHASHASNGDTAIGHAANGHAANGHAAGDGRPGAGGRATPAGSGTGDGGLAARLRHTLTLLPPPLGAPTELVDLGRATRLIGPALRRALTTRDGGCVAAGCDRPAPWTDAHHLVHWLHGGPTSLDNLVLLCRVHHRAVHEGGWHLGRDPTSGQHTLTPPARHLIPTPA